MYQPGDLVWAKLGRHPWWPSLICPSPDNMNYEKMSKGGKHYHVQFIQDKPTHAWVRLKLIQMYRGIDVPECKPGGLYYSKKKSFLSALSSAEEAEAMDVTKRFQVFCHADKVWGESKKSPGRPKKRKNVSEEASSDERLPPLKKYKPAPRSILRGRLERRRFRIGVTPVPEPWLNTYVLMNTMDIPEELTPSGHVTLESDPPSQPAKSGTKVNTKAGRQGRPKKTSPSSLSKEVVPDPSSDDDDNGDGSSSNIDAAKSGDKVRPEAVRPRGRPKKTSPSKLAKAAITDLLIDGDDEDNDPDFVADEKYSSEEDILADDSDEDPGWSPGGKKKVFIEKKKKKFHRPTSLKQIKKALEEKNATKDSTTTPSTSSTSTGAAPVKKTTPISVVQVDDKESNDSEDDASSSENKLVVGDFVTEKASILNDAIPFIWRLKRGNLIQKFEKTLMEDGSQGYKNMVNFADWSVSNAKRFVKIECVLVMMNKAKKEEIFKVTKMPSVDKEEPAVSPPETKSSPAPKKAGRPPTHPLKLSNTQEQEVSSTTSEPDFTVGDFVIDRKDMRNVDNFSIWKIESNILLRKYEPISVNGKMLHKPVKTYRGFRDINKSYQAIKVRTVENGNVEVSEDTRPKLYVNESMEEEYDRNPLLRHFYVYLQVILSQALEPGFMDNIKKTQNPTYILPIGEIDKIINQKCTNIERKVRWTKKLQKALKLLPYLREVQKREENKKCEACSEGNETVEESVFLFGTEYNPDNLQTVETTIGQNLEFKIGPTAMKHILPYHQLCHFKFNLYGRCKSKIKLIQDGTNAEPHVREVMDQCLGNKYWVLQAFEDFIKLVELPYH